MCTLVGSSGSSAASSSGEQDQTTESSWNHRRHRMQLSQAVESYLLSAVHQDVMAALQCAPWLKHVQQMLREALLEVTEKTKNGAVSLHMREEFRCDLSAACSELRQVGNHITPLEKLLCVKRTCAAIGNAVEQALVGAGRDVGKYQLTTDDLLDQLVAVVVKSYPHSLSLPLDLVYMQYHNANVSSCV